MSSCRERRWLRPRSFPPMALALSLLLTVCGPQLCSADDSLTTENTQPLEAEDVARLEPMKLKQLLVKSQIQIEVTRDLEGVLLVEPMKLTKADEHGKRILQLKGRARDATQFPRIAREVNRVMQSDSFWSTSEDEFAINAESLISIEPSDEAGEKLLNQAREHFLAGRYDEAEELFTQALVECHDREHIQYWKVANAIALKQTDRAEQRLEILIRKNPRGSDACAGKLQKLQGQYRQAMLKLEQKIMLKNRQTMEPRSK